ncbi:hypothetical protein ACET3Z_027605 [Daucus carota]
MMFCNIETVLRTEGIVSVYNFSQRSYGIERCIFAEAEECCVSSKNDRMSISEVLDFPLIGCGSLDVYMCDFDSKSAEGTSGSVLSSCLSRARKSVQHWAERGKQAMKQMKAARVGE